MDTLPKDIIDIIFSYIPCKDPFTSYQEVARSLLRFGLTAKKYYKRMPSLEEYKSNAEKEKKSYVEEGTALIKFGLSIEEINDKPFIIKNDIFMKEKKFYLEQMIMDIAIKKYKSYHSYLVIKQNISIQRRQKIKDEEDIKKNIQGYRKRTVLNIIEKYQLNILLSSDISELPECIGIMKTMKKYVRSTIFFNNSTESEIYELDLTKRLVKEINYYVWCHKRRLVLIDTLSNEHIDYKCLDKYEFVRNEVERYVFNELYSIDECLHICRTTYTKLNLMNKLLEKCEWSTTKHSLPICSYMNNHDSDQKKVFRDTFQQIFEIEFFETYTNYKKIYRNIIKLDGPKRTHQMIDFTAKKEAITNFFSNQTLQSNFSKFMEKHTSNFIRIVMNNLATKYIDDISQEHSFDKVMY